MLLLAVDVAAPRADAASVAIVPWPRNERGATAGLKTTSYAENVIALAEAQRQGAEEAIFGNCAGDLCEGTGTNVFVLSGGRLRTPPLRSGCLAGVTRALLLEITDAVEETITLAEFRAAPEAFLCSTTRHVQPIRAIDGAPLPVVGGAVTMVAASAFAHLQTTNPDP